MDSYDGPAAWPGRLRCESPRNRVVPARWSAPKIKKGCRWRIALWLEGTV